MKSKRHIKIERNPLYYTLFDLHIDRTVIKDVNMDEVGDLHGLLNLILSGASFDTIAPARHKRKKEK